MLFLLYSVVCSASAYQLLAYAHDVHLLGHNKDTVKKNTETLINVNKKVNLEINAEIIKYVLLSHHQKAEQNLNICVKIANRYFQSGT
jgi:hypothetical protein